MIIGLTGRAGAGKSYIARHVLVPDGYLPLSFAGPMKAVLAGQGVVPFDEATGLVPYSEKSRRILQLYGTELGRDVYGENYWPTVLSWWIEWFRQRGFHNFVIDDVRFPNEAKWVIDQGGVVLRIVGRQADLGANGAHSSEGALADFTFPEINNGKDYELVQTYSDILTALAEHYDPEE